MLEGFPKVLYEIINVDCSLFLIIQNLGNIVLVGWSRYFKHLGSVTVSNVANMYMNSITVLIVLVF